MARFLASTLGALLAILVISLMGPNAQVASVKWNATYLLSRVKPFNEGHLPCPLGNLPCGANRYLKTFDAPALGRVMSLGIHDKNKPMSSLDMKTMFHVYTRRRDTHAITFQPRSPGSHLTRQAYNLLKPEHDFQYDLRQMAESGFDASKRTIVLIPGYISLEEAAWAHTAADYWLQLLGKEVNVIVVGWHDSNKGLYEDAVANSVLVGRQVAIFLHYLAQLGGTSLKSQRFLDRINIVGHSLGAHIAGYVGKDLGGRVGRITGLDPAGPMFSTFPLDQRLDRGDARLVDVLHTNTGNIKYTGAYLGMLMSTLPSLRDNKALGEGGIYYGTHLQLGHIDYYANSGRTQDGCTDKWHSCDHERAALIYNDMLRHELYLEHTGSKWSRVFHKENRIWAFRADDYETYKTGAQLSKLCPQLLEAATHLNSTLVRQTFGHCAAPLLDVVSPVNGLIRELREKYHVNFESDANPARQPRFYFKTKPFRRDDLSQMISAQYLVKLYLDPQANVLDASSCSLQVNVHMDGEASDRDLAIKLNKLDHSQRIIAVPFAHPAGPRAQAQLLSLLSRLRKGEQASEKFAVLFRDMFPHDISLQFMHADGSAASDDSPSGCQLAIQQVEVAPISVYTKSNIGALYERAAQTSDDQQLTFVSTRELGQRVAAAAPSDKLTLANRYELKSVLMDS